MRKHMKPIDQTPSPQLIEHIGSVQLINAPIADIACGYGRNGAYFVDLGYPLYFVDKDDDGLNFIKKGIDVSVKGDIKIELVKTIKADLEVEKWMFDDDSLGGIINVHYYNKNLIPYFIKSLCIGGFLYIETIDARGQNFLELPEHKYIFNLLSENFEIVHYREKLAEPKKLNVSTVKILAVKHS